MCYAGNLFDGDDNLNASLGANALEIEVAQAGEDGGSAGSLPSFLAARGPLVELWLSPRARAAGAQDVAQHRRVHTIAEGVTTTPAKAATYQVMLDIIRDVGIQGHISARASIRITSTCSWGSPATTSRTLTLPPFPPSPPLHAQTPPQRPKGRRTKLDNRVP